MRGLQIGKSSWHTLFVPLILVLAYVLKGAKFPEPFAVVFLVIAAFFAISLFYGEARHLPKLIAAPFLIWFLWCWIPLLRDIPIDKHLFGLARLSAYLMFALAIFKESDKLDLNHFKITLITLAILETSIFIVVKAWDIDFDPQYYGFLNNPLHSGLLLPVGAAIAMDGLVEKKRNTTVYWLYCLVFLYCCLGIDLIRSRAAMLGIILILLIYLPKSKPLMLVLMLLFALKWLLDPPISFLVYFEINPTTFAENLGRLTIWQTAIAGILHSPLLGYGLGNFESCYRLFQVPSNELLRFGREANQAHNGLLQVATEVGIPGMAMLVWGWTAVLKSAWKNKHLSPDNRWLTAIIAVFFATSLFNYSVLLPFNGLVFSAAIALLVGKNQRENAPSLYGTTLPRINFLLLAVFVPFLILNAISERYLKENPGLAARLCPVRGDAWYASALKKLENRSKTEWINALADINRALIFDKNNAYYWQRKALVLINLFPESAKGAEDIDTAFAKAKMNAPFHAPFYIDEGFHRFNQRDNARALRLFEMAAELEPISPMPHYGIALCYLRDQNQKLAKKHLLHAIYLKEQEIKYKAGSIPNQNLLETAYGRALFALDLAACKDLLKNLSSVRLSSQ